MAFPVPSYFARAAEMAPACPCTLTPTALGIECPGQGALPKVTVRSLLHDLPPCSFQLTFSCKPFSSSGFQSW